jgi:hypothetical protein
MTDSYTKFMLTVIALSLGVLTVQQLVGPARAQRETYQPIYVARISTGAAKCIAGHVTWSKGDTGTCIYDGN